MPKGVEIGYPSRGVPVGNPGGLEVSLNEQIRMLRQVPENRPTRGLRREPGAKGFGQVGPDRLDVIPPALRVGGGHGDGRGVRVEVEPFGAQGPEFIRSKSGPEGQAVESGPIGARGLQENPASLGGLNETGLFLGRQGPAFPALVRIGILARQVG
jgi:hypothetical protein